MGMSIIIKGADFSVNYVSIINGSGGVTPPVIPDEPTIILPTSPIIAITEDGLVTITSENATTIYYTLNGDTPNGNHAVYTQPFTLTESCVVKAIGANSDGYSNVASQEHVKPIIIVNPPTINITEDGLVTITSDDSEVRLYYTINGNIPTTASTQYTQAFSVNSGDRVQAIASKSGVNSTVVEMTYIKEEEPTIEVPQILEFRNDMLNSFIGEDGKINTSLPEYNAMLIDCINGYWYTVNGYIVQSNLRLFTKVGDTYTQYRVWFVTTKFTVKIPNDGQHYVLQMVKKDNYNPTLRIDNDYTIEQIIYYPLLEGYYSDGGVFTASTQYKAFTMNLVPTYTYNVSGNQGNIRVFQKEGDTYTMVFKQNGSTASYTCPNDGKQYVLQVFQNSVITVSKSE